MSLIDVIGDLDTGNYTVTRTLTGTSLMGRYTAGTSSTFVIDASIQPVNGRILLSLPEAQHGEEVRVIYTITELRTRTPLNEPDVVTIDSEAWLVIRSERWEGLGEVYFRAYAARQVKP